MSIVKSSFRDTAGNLLYLIELEDSNSDLRSRFSWIEAAKREASQLHMTFKHKEYPEGIALLFEKEGDYERLMAALDMTLQASAEQCRRTMIDRARRMGAEFPAGFDDEHAIKHGAPPPGGWQPTEPQ